MINTHKIFLIFIIICLFSNSVCLGCEISLEDRIINPEGWNLPDLSRLEKLSSEKKKFPGIEHIIQIDLYVYDEEVKKALYSIHNKQIIYNKSSGSWSVKNANVVEWVKALVVYKIKESQEILCYTYRCISEETPRPKDYGDFSGVVGGVAGVSVESYIFDFDRDGINESLLPSCRSKELLLSILQYKYEQLQQKNK